MGRAERKGVASAERLKRARERARERERAMRFVRFSVKTSGVSLPFPTGVHANHSSNTARESTSDKRVKVTFKLPHRVKFGQEVVLVRIKGKETRVAGRGYVACNRGLVPRHVHTV